MERKNTVCVYGASSAQIDPKYKEAAYEVGRLLASAGYTLVCGGGRSGIMAAAIEGALDGGGEAVGVLPAFMIEKQWQHPQLSRTVVTADMHERKSTMASMSGAVIAMPGGCGTLEELMEIITWRQLNLYHGRVVICNIGGYYDPLISMLDRTLEEGFMRPDHRMLWEIASTANEAVEAAMREDNTMPFSQKIGE
ncbi:MAG: TIGR00730 family Rossman fold protein [Barnesiella sp.]|nr:TIGR00730 family Rossman fold protein [Barnesiella sp.]